MVFFEKRNSRYSKASSWITYLCKLLIINLTLEYTTLFEDDYILAVHKPAGISSTQDLTEGLSMLESLALEHQLEFFQPVHRLDKPTQGILIFAKNKLAFTNLTNQFKNKKVEKTYLAIVRKVDLQAPQRLVHYMLFESKTRKTVLDIAPFDGADEAIMTIEKLQDTAIFSLIKVTPETGRTHQIRAQLAYENMPIVGDIKYGYRRSMRDKTIALLAHSISFVHPITKEKIDLSTQLPAIGIWSNFTLD